MVEFRSPGLCIECYRKQEHRKLKPASIAEHQAYRKRELAATAAAQLLAASKKGFNSSPHIAELVNEILNEFGGLHAFAKSWHYSITVATAADAGSHKVLRAHEQIAQLVLNATRLTPDKSAIEQLTDEEIETELAAILLEQFRAGKINLADELSQPSDVVEGVTVHAGAGA